MHYLCTTCSKRKRRSPGLMAARRRYLSPRLRQVEAESHRQHRPLRILSGQYGLLAPADLIPWYDHALQPEEVAALAQMVIQQLQALEVTTLTFYARPPDAPGWAPYHAVLRHACTALHLPLTVVHLVGGDRR